MGGGMWKTEIETEAHPFSGTPIIPRRINHMSFELESDRATKLKGKYQNANMGRDITWDIVRQPGKSIKAIIVRGGVTSTIEGTLNRSGQDMDIIIKADIRGVKYDGKICVKSASDKTNVVVDIKKGSESVVQLKSEVQVKGTKFRLRSKYSIMGGKVAQGDFKANYQNNKLTFEAPPYKLEVELHLGRSIKVEASKNGESMWTYETLREDKSNPNAIVWEANSKMTLNPASKLHKFIQDNYPFGAFQTRTNNFKLFIDRHNRNFLLRKFKINFDVVKDGNKVIDISGNTVDAPYQFSASAPNLFERLNIAQNPLTMIINHQRGSFLIIDTNIAGGMKLDAKQSPNAGTGGRNSGHFKMTAVGKNARWGDYSVNRDLKWGSSNKKLSLDITGDAEFGAGPPASSSPVQTEVRLNFDVPSADLNGKFMKVFAGKEYSITFNPGFNMPSIKVGA